MLQENNKQRLNTDLSEVDADATPITKRGLSTEKKVAPKKVSTLIKDRQMDQLQNLFN